MSSQRNTTDDDDDDGDDSISPRRYFAEHDKVTALQMLNDSLQPKHKYVSHVCLRPDPLKGELQVSTEKLYTI